MLCIRGGCIVETPGVKVPDVMWLRKMKPVATEAADRMKKGVRGVKLTRTPAERPQNRTLDDDPGESILRCNCRAEGIGPRALQMASLMVFTTLSASAA